MTWLDWQWYSLKNMFIEKKYGIKEKTWPPSPQQIRHYIKDHKEEEKKTTRLQEILFDT